MVVTEYKAIFSVARFLRQRYPEKLNLKFYFTSLIQLIAQKNIFLIEIFIQNDFILLIKTHLIEIFLNCARLDRRNLND